MRHLQRLELGQLLVAAERRNHLPQAVEGVVQAIHSAPLPGVGCETALLQYVATHRLGRLSAALCVAASVSRYS